VAQLTQLDVRGGSHGASPYDPRPMRVNDLRWFRTVLCFAGSVLVLRRGFFALLLAVAAMMTACNAVSAPKAPTSGLGAAGDGMVVSTSAIASKIGAGMLARGGNAIDAAVATAFALAVTHPVAGNIGGGGFLVWRSADGSADAYDFRETAPAASTPTMFLRNGAYDAALHHESHLSVGVPGTVAGLHLAWRDHGTLPWRDLVEPSVTLARDGFVVSDGLAGSLAEILPKMQAFAASVAQFSHGGRPYVAGEVLRQPDLARTLERIAEKGPAGFYQGETAELLVREMQAHGGIITLDDLRDYRAVRRAPLRGFYRGIEVIAMPPPSSGGVALIQMLNMLEMLHWTRADFGSGAAVHMQAECMRRAFLDRARHLGDPDFNSHIPVARLTSKEYARELVKSIDRTRASRSSPADTIAPSSHESEQTTHLSVADGARNAVSLTYTLEQGYGSCIVAPGTGFLLNNEMGDFNAEPGRTDETGFIGTTPNLAAPGKRMLSSMCPTILAKDGALFMVTGSPGGRTIINTVLQTIVAVVDFGMGAQEAVDARRIHHQWLPDRVVYEPGALSPATIAALEAMGHTLKEGKRQGVAEVIVVRGDCTLDGGCDKREPDGAAVRAGATR
jgi:gamma-glutamyltranspeptidase / glutathione hydrolase